MVQKNPGMAAVLNFLIPGIGSIYLGNWLMAVVHLGIAFFVSSSIYSIYMNNAIYGENNSYSFYLAMGILNICLGTYKAYYDAEQYNASLILQKPKDNTENSDGFAWSNSKPKANTGISPWIWAFFSIPVLLFLFFYMSS